MKSPEHPLIPHPSPQAVQILCERLQRMGVSISEQAARSLLESVLAVEGANLQAQVRVALQASLENIRRTADAALTTLTGSAPEQPRRDYELSFPPPPNLVGAVKDRAAAEAEPRRRPHARRPTPEPIPAAEVEEPRPVFKRPRR
jgi:hypothetical protein